MDSTNGHVPVTSPEYRRGQAPPNKGRRFPAEPLTLEEVRQLLAACPSRGKTGVRDRALIVVLWRAGLRVSEATALYPKDVDVAGGAIAVLHGKGDKRRTVGIDPEALAVVQRWLELRRGLGLTGRFPLFCTLSRGVSFGRAMRPSLVRQMLKHAAERAGLEKRVHPHGLRHTHAFELANEGVPVHVIQDQLGHNSLAVTERYIRHLAPVARVRAMRARTWEATAD